MLAGEYAQKSSIEALLAGKGRKSKKIPHIQQHYGEQGLFPRMK